MNKKWIKFVVGFLLVLVLLYFFLPRKDINLVTQMSQEETEGLRRVLDRYERYNLVNFNIVNISFNNHYNRIEEFINSEQRIDIARGDIKMPKWFKKYVANNRTEPQAVDCLVLFYNPNIIEAPPETIEEFIALTKENTVDKSSNVFGTENFATNKIKEYGAHLPLSSGWWMSTFFGAEDNNFFKSDFDEEEFLTTANKFKELYDMNLLAIPSKDDFYGTMMNRFKDGKVGMMINGPWAISELREAEIKFKIALLPQGDEGRFSPMGGQQWIMLNDRPEVQAVMDYLASSEVANLLYRYNGTLVPNESFLDKLEENENDVVAKQLKEAVKIDKELDYKLYKYFSNDFLEYIKGEINEQELLENWRQQLE
ncbi:MAG: sugar ABC transporter substrate-binding protein [Bacillota bacterium]